MRMHPLWRGFWLAAAMAAGLVLLGGTSPMGAGSARSYLGAITVGAFLGALPGYLRKGRKPHFSLPWKRALRDFLCGFILVLALSLAGDVPVLPGLLTGSAGAYAFAGMALLSGFVTVRIMGRARA